jgi:hypothetical protein
MKYEISFLQYVMLANVHMFTLSFLATMDNDCDDADIGKITSNS